MPLFSKSSYVVALHHGDRAAVHDDRTREVAHVRRFAAAGIDFNAEFSEFCEEVLRAQNKLRKSLARKIPGVAVYGVGKQNALDRADAEKVVYVHHDGILRDSPEYRCVARFPVLEVRYD